MTILKRKKTKKGNPGKDTSEKGQIWEGILWQLTILEKNKTKQWQLWNWEKQNMVESEKGQLNNDTSENIILIWTIMKREIWKMTTLEKTL